MDFALSRLNFHLNHFDRDLYAFRMPNGIINVMRQGKRIDDSMLPYDLENLDGLKPNPQYLFSLTHNWNLTGNSVEWGIEPILIKLQEMDSWGHEISLSDMQRRREAVEADKKRQHMNEFRAAASEVRRPFAKLTNDYLVRSKINGNRK